MPKPDACSLMIFVDEGLMFHRILNQQAKHPDTAPILMLSALPFCALAAHDSIKFAKTFVSGNMPPDSASVNKLRNYSKALADTGVSIADYAETTRQISKTLSAEAKSHTGIFASTLNAIQPDVAIFYYDDAPILTTYVTARYIGVESMFSPNPCTQLGYELGQAAALNFVTVSMLENELTFDSAIYTSCSFETSSRDAQYDALMKPLAGKGMANQTCFFLLSEILMQMNSIGALWTAGIFSDALYLKFGTAALVAANQSLSKLSKYLGRDPSRFNCTASGTSALENILPRKTRKKVKSIRKIRNALVHYDFAGLIGSTTCLEKSPEEILDQSVITVGFENSAEYLSWLHTTLDVCAGSISSLIELPGPQH